MQKNVKHVYKYIVLHFSRLTDPNLNLQHVICFLEESYLKNVSLHCYMFDVRNRQNNAEPVC